MQSEFRTHIRRYLSLVLAPMLLLLLLLAGCSTTSGTTANSTTGPGASSSPTATTGSGSSGTGGSGDTGSGSSTPVVTAPQHAFAWTQYDHASTPTPQIWASINGGIPRQITHLPPITSGCDTQIEWGLPVFSPDLTHIVASIGSPGCGDGSIQGPIDIITVSTGAISPIPTGDAFDLSSDRTDGWLSDTTVFFINGNGLYTYTLGAGSPVLVASLVNPFEAIVRGSILFWQQMSFNTTTNNWSTTVQRYNIATHTALAGSIPLGQVHECKCSPGDFNLQGWDVSPDGSHIVYQLTTPLTGDNFGVASSRIYYATADGGGATQIARYMSTNQPARLQISPNGQMVAFSNALPSPSVISASVTSPGNAGDPNFHVYTPDTTSFPVWKWNSSSFWASSGGEGTPGTAIHYFTVGVSGSVIGVNHGFNPWYTIVS